MDGSEQLPVREYSIDSDILRVAQAGLDEAEAISSLLVTLGAGPFALIKLFVSPTDRFADLMREASEALPDTQIIGCTTAGEIGPTGYQSDQVVAIGYPASHFAAETLLIRDIAAFDAQSLLDKVIHQRLGLADRAADKPNCFAFLLIDGLSQSEDILTAALSPALGDMPLFGGSAGDGYEFGTTEIALNGAVYSEAAVLSMVRTTCQTRVFSLDHLVPGTDRMVVTEADPRRRIVKTINAEPAGREYARIMGMDPDQLDTFTFASHPVVVRMGDIHHVRAIRNVNEKGELVFFSAIDEGMVLTVADRLDLVDHLDRELSLLCDDKQPLAIVACDCLLRRIEAEQMQITRQVSETLSRHKVVGFSTYGEQIGPLHVNHTMTGVVLFPPKTDRGAPR
ncbi:FIST N-terminal domain-containing protein [Litoreibacter roseus]|uniref:GfdT protein n=1 Tax=Litoreibacter roseus TaxID=2601869 RepID=A0A6N6JDK3_9RHOB|nr:FIST N-terminal domain-containing protein [Litoreibacter roseus]GFE64214.1 hypothetical protein KIN_12880 [Litoreibacter roseus]